MIRYRVPFAPDRLGSRYKARVQFTRLIVGQGADGTLYTTPEASLAVEFEAPSHDAARRELARRIRPLDPRPVRGATALALRLGQLSRRHPRVGAPPRGTGPGLVG